MKFRLCVFCLFFFTWGLSAEKVSAGVFSDWHEDLDLGIAEARERKLPVLVNFYAPWCELCDIMRREVFPSNPVLRESSNFVRIAINSDEHPEWLEKFDLAGVPSLVFLDGNGYFLSKSEGFLKSDPLARRMRDVFRRSEVEAKILEMLERTPGDVLANYRAGIYYHKASMFERARRYFLKAWNSPENPTSDGVLHARRDSIFNAAVASMDLYEYSQAVSQWNAYLGAFSGDAGAFREDVIYAHFYRGVSLRALGQYARADADLDLAAKSLADPEDRAAAQKLIGSRL